MQPLLSISEGMSIADRTAPNASDFEEIVRTTVATLPEAFRDAAQKVVVRVEDFPSEAMLAEMELDDVFSLTGLYEGIPVTEKSVMDQPQAPDAIWLFRRAILDEWADRGDVTLKALVAHVYVHELAHHFGWSDDDIATIDEWWT